MTERIEKIREFLKQSPDDCFLNHALALELIKNGQDMEAKLVFEKNLAFDPGYIATYYHLGKLLERLGQAGEAAAVYEQGIQRAGAAGDMHSRSELQAAREDI